MHQPRAHWVEECHQVPMTEVMIDGSDYRQPIVSGIPPVP